MNRNKLFVFLILLFPVFLSAQSMEGSWTAEVPGQEEGTTMTVVLKMANGGYAVDFGNDGVNEVNGTYIMEGNKMTIEDIDGTNACVGKIGVYEVSVDDKNLILARISDECEGRGGPEGMAFTRM